MITENGLDLKSFQTQFNKSFVSFCHHLPIVVTFGVNDTQVVIVEEHPFSKEKRIILTYTFNYVESVKKNIYNIKQQLKDYFPTFTFVNAVEKEYSPEEILESDQDPLTMLDEKQYNFEPTEYRIEKVLLLQDKLVVRDMNTNTAYLMKARCPVSVLVRNIRFSIPDSEKGIYFFKKVDILKVVDEKNEE